MNGWFYIKKSSYSQGEEKIGEGEENLSEERLLLPLPKPHPLLSQDFHQMGRPRHREISTFAMDAAFQLYEIQNEFLESHREGECLPQEPVPAEDHGDSGQGDGSIGEKGTGRIVGGRAFLLWQGKAKALLEYVVVSSPQCGKK